MSIVTYTDSKFRDVAKDLPDHLFEKLVSDIRNGLIVSTWASTNDFSHTMLRWNNNCISLLAIADMAHLACVAYHLWEHKKQVVQQGDRRHLFSYNILTYHDACRLAEVFGAPTPEPVNTKKLPFPRFPAYVIENYQRHALVDYDLNDFRVHGQVQRVGSSIIFETEEDAALFVVMAP